LYRKNSFDIFKCDSCGLVFTRIPPGYDLSKIYTEDYFTGNQTDGYAHYKESEKVLRREFRKSAALLWRLTGQRENLKLLEVGSAYGYFLDEAKDYFDCRGIEISREAVKFSVARGRNVLCGQVTDELLKEIGNVDIIAMFDVIEHLPNPVEVLSFLDKYLNAGGLLMVVTGDIDSLLAKVMQNRWRLMTPPQHTFFFSQTTLENVLQKFNYKVILKERPWKFVPLGLIAYQLGNWVGMRSKWLEQLGNIGVSINLFDTLRIVAEKN
jgi:2-polyprenyl-3-methyl-5-hydroxy-6-metoxy-1,4-benzoquinol methylase